MNCPKCGTNLADGTPFCSSCGTQLNAPPPAQQVHGAPPGGSPWAPAGAIHPPAPPPPPPYGAPMPGGPMPYGMPPTYPYGMAPPVMTRTSGMAIAGFVLSFFCSLLGLIFSIIGYNECKRSNGEVTGEGMALAGIIISIIGMLLGLIIVASGSSSHHY